MSLCERIQEWASAQHIEEWQDVVKDWAFDNLGWNEHSEAANMLLDITAEDVVYMLRDYLDIHPLHGLDDAELGRWVAEQCGFRWEDSLDKAVEDENEAFKQITAIFTVLCKD